MNEFLLSIYEERLLKFQYQQGNWDWKIEKIKSLGITDNLVELMAKKIHKLPDATENLLKVAACIGNKFELDILSQFNQTSPQQTALYLQNAIVEGLLIPLTESYKLVELNFSTANTKSTIEYKFVHDRVQQAAYSLMSEEEQKNTHWNIGNLLLANISKSEQEKKIFDLVNQLNLGIKSISLASERYEIANLNLIAAKKALTSAAYQPALSYLKISIQLLAKDGWEQCYDLTLEVYQQAAKAAYLSSQFEQMGELISEIKTQGKNLLDKLKADEIQILAYKNQNKSLDAIDLALDNLQILGTKIHKTPQKYHVLLALLQTKLVLIGQDIDKLVDLPMMTDTYKKTTMEFIASVSASAYVASPQTMLLLICKQVNLSVKYGNTPHAAFAYATYGLIQCSIVGNMELGAKFAQIAIKLIEKLNTQETKTKTLYIINCFIRHWNEPAIASAKSLLEIYKNGLETGDLQFTSFAGYVSCYYFYLAGKQLSSLKKRITSLTESPIIQNQVISLYNCQLINQVVLNLIAESEHTYDLNGPVFYEEKMISIYQETKYITGLVYYYINKMILCYLFGEYDQCLENSQLAKKSLASVIGLMFVPVFYFYDSLIQLAVYDGDKSKQRSLLKLVKDNQKKMKKWAKSAPMNYQHKFYLVKAEVYRILGKQQKAMKLYDQAIFKAKDNDYLQEAVMSYELAAKFYMSINQEIIAKAYMQEALYFYQFWGAIAKVKDLETKYSQLLTTTSLPSQNSQTITSTSGSNANLDLATVMKSSQAISGEIELDKLLSNLMKIVIENVGAQTGYLIFATQDILTIAASGTIEDERVAILESIPLKDYQKLPHAIINYVKRTQEIVILHDANKEEQFSNDIYIKTEKPKSILCVPLINQGKLISIIYLENNLTTGAFTEERVEILKLLSAQAAISIENARLYKNMADLNQAYERFVPGEFLDFLNKDSIIDVKVGDQIQLEMSVLFSDIRDFTTLSEKMTPEENFKFINSYLSRMEMPISNNHGFIDKYIGDAIMALFSGKADNAVKAGISMLKELVEYNQDRIVSGYPQIKIGIGINTGSLILGTVGGKNRMDSTVISDAVNLASRVESLTKNYGVSLLITEQTYKKLHYPDNYHLRIIDTVKVKGKSQAVTVYEVFDADLPEIKEGKLATLEIFTEALSLYNQGQLAESESMFRDCVEKNPGDRVANIYCQRCQY